MLGWLATAFIVLPLVELYILLRIGEAAGFLPTVALVVGTGLLGAWLARHEGLRTAHAIRQELDAGHIPAYRLMDAALIFAAGILLLTPGVLTDLTGFLLLAPPVRIPIRRWIKAALARHFTPMGPPGDSPPSHRDPEAIDVEWSPADDDRDGGTLAP